MFWNLPLALAVGGTDYEIRTDYRVTLDIFCAFNDPNLDSAGKIEIMIKFLYYPDIPPDEDLQEAVDKAIWYLDCGLSHDDAINKPRTMDWEQDAPIIFPAINKVAGMEVRGREQIHWWTFYGWFSEIYDGLFSQIVGIRQKRAKGKPLDKYEKEFLRDNKNLIVLKSRKSEDEKEQERLEKEALSKII